MAKSIRSKSRRKSRSEFRKTIGTVAYNESMAKIQQKLKESLEKQSMTCIDRLAKTLGTSAFAGDDDVNNAGDIMELDSNASKNAIDACDSMTPQIAIVEKVDEEEKEEQDPQMFKGENKAVIRGKKRRQSKYDLASAHQKKKQHQAASSSTTTGNSRPKPRYFCKF